MHKCKVEDTEICDDLNSSLCLSCDGDDLTLKTDEMDWSFKEKIEDLHSVNATLWDLKFKLLEKRAAKQSSACNTTMPSDLGKSIRSHD